MLGCLVRVCSRYFLICTILDLRSLGVVLKQLLFSLLHPWFTNWGLGTSKNKHHWLWPVDPKDASKCCGIRAISWLSQTSGVTYPSFWLSPCDQGVHKLCKLSYCPCKRFQDWVTRSRHVTPLQMRLNLHAVCAFLTEDRATSVMDAAMKLRVADGLVCVLGHVNPVVKTGTVAPQTVSALVE